MARISMRTLAAAPSPRRTQGMKSVSDARAARCGGLRVLLACALSMMALAPAASAANGPDRPPTFEPAAPPALAGKSAQPAQARKRLTKFEARRIRHACQGRANERGLGGPEREAFLGRCYFGRVSTRVERQQCRQEAAARGVERGSLRAYIRDCVRDRLRAREERKN